MITAQALTPQREKQASSMYSMSLNKTFKRGLFITIFHFLQTELIKYLLILFSYFTLFKLSFFPFKQMFLEFKHYLHLSAE